MSYPTYYPVAGDILPHLFSTYGGTNGESVTMTGFAVTDIEIYKDGSTTQRASDSGVTLLDTDGTDFDGITGIHGFQIDLSDNTDANFYSTGSWFHVVVSAVTVDTQTVSFVACAFRIISATRGLAGTALPDAAADAAGGLPISDAGGLDLDTLLGYLTATVATASALATAQADLDTLTGTDGATLATSQPNYAPATATALSTAQADLDTITGSDGVTLATAQANYAPSKAGDAMALTSGERTTLAGVIWDSLTSGMVTVGSIGKKLADWTIHSAADVWAVATRVLTANTNLNDPTAAAIADAVWDETLSDHLGAGSTGTGLNSASSAGDPWATALPGAYGAGTAGKIIGDNINAPLDTIDANVDAILTDTGTTIPAQITGLNDPTAAQVADAVWDEAQSGHTTAGTFGKYLDTEVSGVGGGSLTEAGIADAVWEEALADHSGTAGSTAEALSNVSAPGSKIDIDGLVDKSGSNYLWIANLRVNGSVVNSGLSNLTVVGAYGNNGETDLSYSAVSGPTIGTNHSMYGSFTLGTTPTTGTPWYLEITVDYGGTTYRGRLQVVVQA